MSRPNDIYDIRVRPPVIVAGQWADEEDESLVDGTIELTYESKKALEARLTALQAADYIGEWVVERHEDPSRFSEAGVLNFIAGLDPSEPDHDAIRALWAETSF